MKKSPNSLITILFLTGLCYCVYYLMMPRGSTDKPSPSGFSTSLALDHVRKIAAKPHYTGSQGHKEVSDYIIKELKALGLQPQIQKGFSVTEKNVLAYSENILARIKGENSSKALLLLSHYDSAPHSKSKGAADNATGVATILEGLRAYLQSQPGQRNDIIILFSDTEEVGLNGAALFVKKHPWAKDVGLALNFEARGTAGPSYMLMEVNQGNASMVKGFSDAAPGYPVANSLMYSIYKMLPNDTDLTVFRESGKIQGFNFAFIDDHFNYHTAQDDLQHLDRQSLAHQGSYLMPLLSHFANADLVNLNSESDYVYFNVPFSIVTYPFAWVVPMAFIALALFLGLLTVGFAKKILDGRQIAKGFLIYTGCLILLPAMAFLCWQLILIIYPSYRDIAHGFTYNGHWYIAALLALALSLALLAYKMGNNPKQAMSYYVAPLTLVLALNFIVAFMLPGAGFLIIPLFASLLSFGVYIVTQKHFWFLNLLLTIPACIVFYPLVTAMPVGLGLKNIFISVLLVVIVFGLILPVVTMIRGRKFAAYTILCATLLCLILAHTTSGYEKGTARPNSLVYISDGISGETHWASYDRITDEWTSTMLGQQPEQNDPLDGMKIGGKYGMPLRFSASAAQYEIPAPTINTQIDTTIANSSTYSVTIVPNRPVNRYDVYLSSKTVPSSFSANGESVRVQRRTGERFQKLLQYYVVENQPLQMRFTLPVGQKPDLVILESSFDLTEHPAFDIVPRPENMMPMPFVLNDAVILKERITWPASKILTDTIPQL